MTVVQAILEEKPLTVVVSFDAFMDALPVKGAMKDRVIRIGKRTDTGTLMRSGKR